MDGKDPEVVWSVEAKYQVIGNMLRSINRRLLISVRVKRGLTGVVEFDKIKSSFSFLNDNDWREFDKRGDVNKNFGIGDYDIRVGRSKEMKEIWAKVSVEKSIITAKSICYYIQASPGGGKSFTLRQLTKKSPSDIDEKSLDFAIKTMLLILDFNNNLCNDIKTFSKSISNFLSPEFLPLLRLFHSEFLQSSYPFGKLLNHVIKYLSNNTTDEYNLISDIKRLFKAKCQYLGYRYMVVLVDEIGKTAFIVENKPLLVDSYRSAICAWSDGSADGSKPFVTTSIFSTLDRDLILDENSVSGRPMEAATTLPMLSLSESTDLLMHQLKCSFKDGNGIGIDKKDVVGLLASVSGGHPRAIEYLWNSCNNAVNEGIEEIITAAGRRLSGAYARAPWDDVIKLVLLGKRVPLDYVVPSTNLTVKAMLRLGVLIGSVDNSTTDIMPITPEIFLYWWSYCGKELDPAHKADRAALRDLLLTRRSFTRLKWEDFHTAFERVMRHMRGSNYDRVPVHALYGQDESSIIRSSRSALFRMIVDGTTPLTSLYYDTTSESKVELKANHIYIPSSGTNHGWDSLIVYQAYPPKKSNKQSAQYLLPVFIQNKFSIDRSTYTVDLKMIEDSKLKCQQFLGQKCHFPPGYRLLPKQLKWEGWENVKVEDKFILIFVAKTKHTVEAATASPANVLPLFEANFEELYGPTLTRFIDTLVPDSDVIVN